MPDSIKNRARNTDQNFMKSPEIELLRSIERVDFSNRGQPTLDPGMQGYQPAGEVVVIHMPKATRFHQGFQLLLAWVHANRLGQIAVAGIITGHQLAQLGRDLAEYQS